MPSIIGAIAGAIVTRVSDSDLYTDDELLLVFPDRHTRTPNSQVIYQFLLFFFLIFFFVFLFFFEFFEFFFLEISKNFHRPDIKLHSLLSH